jgi:hypothetical protein
MGPRSDPHAVVDASGAVQAVAGLSVAEELLDRASHPLGG